MMKCYIIIVTSLQQNCTLLCCESSGKAAIVDGAAAAVRAVGLEDGPVHIDLRVGPGGVQVIEIDARSIGGHCGRSLRFAGGMRLEEIILRQAAGLPIAPEEAGAGGVMMLPIPANGVLRGIRGLEAARRVARVADVSITIPLGQPVRQLPEGGRYLGFIIAHGETPEEVAAALRAAHAELDFEIEEIVS